MLMMPRDPIYTHRESRSICRYNLYISTYNTQSKLQQREHHQLSSAQHCHHMRDEPILAGFIDGYAAALV